jgi:hypothetical protein
MFGAKRDEVTGEWSTFFSEELHQLYSSPNIVRVIKSRRMRCAGHVTRMVKESVVCSVLVGNMTGKKPRGRPRRRWEGNVRMVFMKWGY